jgi:hypothetical protein
MMLACPALRVVPVTIHLSLADAGAGAAARRHRARRPHRRRPALKSLFVSRGPRLRRSPRSIRMPASRARWAPRRSA